MKSGVIGLVESGNKKLNDFTSTVEVEGDQWTELNQSLQVTGNFQLDSKRIGQLARAAMEDISSVEKTEIDEEGNIRTYEDDEKIVRTTDLLFVPGSFIVVGSSAGKFAFELISNNTSNNITHLEFDISSYVESQQDANPWKAGFYDRKGYAESGVVHGEQLLSGSEIKNILDSSPKNQIGLEYNYKNILIRNFITESGYVEVYEPTDYSSGEFAEYVENELIPYARKP